MTARRTRSTRAAAPGRGPCPPRPDREVKKEIRHGTAPGRFFAGKGAYFDFLFSLFSYFSGPAAAVFGEDTLYLHYD